MTAFIMNARQWAALKRTTRRMNGETWRHAEGGRDGLDDDDDDEEEEEEEGFAHPIATPPPPPPPPLSLPVV